MTEYVHKVQYYETDKMSIVHHSNYIRWFEEARIDWLEKAGCHMKTIEDAGVLIPVLSVTCNYHSMVRFGDNVIVKTKVESFNGAKVVFSYEIVDEATGEKKNTGSSTHCFIDGDGKLISLKKYNVEMYEKLKGFVD
ncbi:MAG: acyl-CoA thioesterase [Lachnospiraceae bacterium]|nr:acyl-CoA thioesterase [Lachnospiraceae bacterium]